MEREKKAYFEILKALKKYRDVCIFDVDDLERKSKYHLFGLELKEDFGLNINPESINSLDWIKLGEHIVVGFYGEKYRRTISWSDDGAQPDDELLLQISFPTGAYIFGDDYPTDLFKKFFLELKNYKPKYIDSHNHCLYFSMNNAKDIFNKFGDIMKRYYEINKEDFKQRKIQKIKDELKRLENN